jgi:hypothetical protein
MPWKKHDQNNQDIGADEEIPNNIRNYKNLAK